MRVGIIIDSSCDLPKSYLEHHNVNIIPMSIIGGEKPFYDFRDKDETTAFGFHIKKSKNYYESQAPSKEEIEHFFLTKAILQYEYVIFITASSYRSKTYDNANAAIASVLPQYRALREKAGLTGNFQVRVIDSQTLLCGQGVVVSEIVNYLHSGTTPTEVTERALKIAHHTQAYLIPSELYFLYEKAKKKGDQSVSALEYMIGSALKMKPIILSRQGNTAPIFKVQGFQKGVKIVFDFVTEEINKGLLSTSVCISYGGNRSLIKTLPGYLEMEQAAKEKGIALLVSKMSMTAMANVGPDALCIAFAASVFRTLTK